MNIVIIPSVGGGLGHIGRTAALARMLGKLDPAVNISYVLDTERLRPFNIEATERTGYPVTLLPPRLRDRRDAVVRNCLGHADVIIDDTQRHLIPLRQILPNTAWISIPMFPLGDELFNDWPLLLQTDAIVWAYPPVLDFPPELAIVQDRVLRAGPFLELDSVPDRKAARQQLGFAASDEIVMYAPRGMSFGRDFGETVLRGVFGAVEALRQNRPKLRLLLVAVSSPDELHAPGVPAELPEWVTVVGVIPPQTMLTYIRAADIAVTEGSNMTQEAAALGTPIVMVPGSIYETWLLGTRLYENQAAHILWIERVTPEAMIPLFGAVLTNKQQRTAMTAKAKQLIVSGGGVTAAARRVLEVGQQKAEG